VGHHTFLAGKHLLQTAGDFRCPACRFRQLCEKQNARDQSQSASSAGGRAFDPGKRLHVTERPRRGQRNRHRQRRRLNRYHHCPAAALNCPRTRPYPRMHTASRQSEEQQNREHSFHTSAPPKTLQSDFVARLISPNVAAHARRACGLRNETETQPRRCLMLPCWAVCMQHHDLLQEFGGLDNPTITPTTINPPATQARRPCQESSNDRCAYSRIQTRQPMSAPKSPPKNPRTPNPHQSNCFMACRPNARPEWRGAEGVEMRSGRAIPRPL